MTDETGRPGVDLGIPGIGPATEIGVGASAVVYRARQVEAGRDVAVKVLTSADENFVRRFEREAKALWRLSRLEGIVEVYGTGAARTGQPYLLLQLCESSLLDEVRTKGPLATRDACAILGPVAKTIAAAHREGVVHRDLKPGNVLVDAEGRYLITDFGLSTVLGTTGGQTSNVGFTAGYASPETFDGSKTDGRAADVYALGATLFHLITGEAPFATSDGDDNILAVITRIANDPIPDLRAGGVPDRVCELIESLMAKDPERRPAADEAANLIAETAGALGDGETRGLGAGWSPPHAPPFRRIRPRAQQPARRVAAWRFITVLGLATIGAAALVSALVVGLGRPPTNQNSSDGQIVASSMAPPPSSQPDTSDVEASAIEPSGPTTATTDPATTTTTTPPTSATTVTTSTTPTTTTTATATTITTATTTTTTTTTTTAPVQLDPPRSLTGNYSDFSSEAVIRWIGPANTTGLTGYTIFADGAEQWTCPIGGRTGICFGIEAAGWSWIDISPSEGTTTYQIRADGPANGPPVDSPLSAPLLLVTS